MLKNEIDILQKETSIVGVSPSIIYLMQQIRDIAPIDYTVLIQGETGTGKELVAKALHKLSTRRLSPFAAINCAAISPHLFESELFGHEKGAFTGAHHFHRGVFEQVKGGSLFLDEIGELSLEFQAKLLRALESNSIRRVGGREEISIDARIIAATNRNLWELVQKKLFREDFYYRIQVIPFFVPPLRSRLEDIPLLVRYFIDLLSPNSKKELSKEALKKLLSYSWPGNVRELKNIISRSLISSKGQLIGAKDILLENFQTPDSPLDLGKLRNRLIEQTYLSTNSIRQTGKILGISKSTVQRVLKEKKQSGEVKK